MKIVNGVPYLPQIRHRIEEYTASPDHDLTFRHLRDELTDLAAPDNDGQVVGCVAYHRCGFAEIPSYYHNPIPCVTYRKLEL